MNFFIPFAKKRLLKRNRFSGLWMSFAKVRFLQDRNA